MSIQLFEIAVLLVEPSSAQKNIICTYLEKLDVANICWVKTGELAMENMRKDTPDLVISAMHLEDMTGAELVQNMRMVSSTESLPFMLVSSETSFRYLEPIRQAGVIAILPKPFSPEQLKVALESTLDYIDPGELETRQFSAEELKVLVVDDSHTARRHIIRVLGNMGIENIMQAQNGKEALEVLAENYFDLLVTDYNMPTMDGRELVEQIRKESNQATLPILMVSSEKDESRIASVQQAGISALCDKPFESSTVKQIIERIVA